MQNQESKTNIIITLTTIFFVPASYNKNLIKIILCTDIKVQCQEIKVKTLVWYVRFCFSLPFNDTNLKENWTPCLCSCFLPNFFPIRWSVKPLHILPRNKEHFTYNLDCSCGICSNLNWDYGMQGCRSRRDGGHVTPTRFW